MYQRSKNYSGAIKNRYKFQSTPERETIQNVKATMLFVIDAQLRD